MKSDSIIQEYIIPYSLMTFMSNKPLAVVDTYFVQLNTNPETMATGTAWLTSLLILLQRYLCISLYFYDITDSTEIKIGFLSFMVINIKPSGLFYSWNIMKEKGV